MVWCKRILRILLFFVYLMFFIGMPVYAVEISNEPTPLSILPRDITEIGWGEQTQEKEDSRELSVFTTEDITKGCLSEEEWRLLYDYYLSCVVYSDVPLLFQTDYPDIPFSHGTVYTSACGVSCAAMVISYLDNTLVTPGELGLQFNTPGCSNVERMEQALDYFGVQYEVAYDWEDVYSALADEQVVISLQGPGLFTECGHFIVLTGINERGLITVNDPYEPHYTIGWERIQGFENGFTEDQVKAHSGVFWIIEKKELPDAKFIGDNEVLKQLIENNVSYSMSAS